MRKLAVSYGGSCNAGFWSNKTVEWTNLMDRLRVPLRTPESAGEYASMGKAAREKAKDHGGFVGGHLSGNRRRAENVAFRSMVTLDGDRLEKDFLDRFPETCRWEACVYTTHSHRPDEPRARVLVPLSRDVTPEEYVAVARYLASDWGIDQFDECSYRPNQMMYWPSAPSDGEYVFKEVRGVWLDPDAFLADHPLWRDCSLLPTSSRESSVRGPSQTHQEDPLSKKGVVGAFCRTYSIQDVMEKFLSDVYAPSAVEGRYDYVKGEGKAGVVVYDGRFAYSHHATDPACGRLLNAFDLVRIHRFGDDDTGESFKAMSAFAVADGEVRKRLTEERLDEAKEEFSDGKTGDGEDWRKRLTFRAKSGTLEDTVPNLVLILENDPDFQNIAFNELAGRVQVTGKVPWDRPEGNPYWRDADTDHLKALLDRRYTAFSTRNHDVAFGKVVDDRHYNPIKEYLDGLPKWDGAERVEDVFIRYLGADDSTYVRAVTRKTFAAAVARVYRPGVKFDCVPVLDGMQGIGKSSLMRDLFSPAFFSDALTLTDMSDKTGAEKLQGYWAVEIGELAGMRKADIERVKSFISTADDSYRPSYGRVVESHPRRCVIFATVNGERGYLRDITGNRRFWIVKCRRTEPGRTWEFDKYWRDQFWAEAKALWLSGEKLYLEGVTLRDSEKAQREAMETDDRIGQVEEYLDTPLPESWKDMDIYARRTYLSGGGFGTPKREEGRRRSEVSNAEIWCECFGHDFSELRPADSYAIAAMMLQIPGWERTTRIRRQPVYGRQRVYMRV